MLLPLPSQDFCSCLYQLLLFRAAGSKQMCYQYLRKVTGLTLEITDLFHFLTFVLRSAKRSFLSIYLTIVEIMILSLCINLALPLMTPQCIN